MKDQRKTYLDGDEGRVGGEAVSRPSRASEASTRT